MRRVDPLSPAARSERMSKVRSTGNASTELVVVRTLKAFRITGWRRHLGWIPGKPDFYFPSARVAVFVQITVCQLPSFSDGPLCQVVPAVEPWKMHCACAFGGLP